jgi:hypothetical protein
VRFCPTCQRWASGITGTRLLVRVSQADFLRGPKVTFEVSEGPGISSILGPTFLAHPVLKPRPLMHERPLSRQISLFTYRYREIQSGFEIQQVVASPSDGHYFQTRFFHIASVTAADLINSLADLSPLHFDWERSHVQSEFSSYPLTPFLYTHQRRLPNTTIGTIPESQFFQYTPPDVKLTQFSTAQDLPS